MDAVLEQLGQIPGVVGAMVYDQAGTTRAARFPELFDRAALERVAATLGREPHLEAWLRGPTACLDLRFGEGRVVLRPLPGAWLLVLCTAQVNGQLLSLSLTQALRRLSTQPPPPPPPPPLTTGSPARTPTGPTPAVSPVDALRAELVQLIEAELGSYSGQAVELLGRATTVGALAEAAGEAEQLTRLFVSKRKAEELGRKVREVFQRGAQR